MRLLLALLGLLLLLQYRLWLGEGVSSSDRPWNNE